MKNRAKTYTDLTPNQIKDIRDSLDKFIRNTADGSGICAEAVAAIAFYRLQRHPTWGRNATPTQKNAAYKHWKGVCHRCNEEVGRAEAKFHHLNRGVPNQHEPSNLVPEHTSCHDDEHNVIYGSLSKGSPRPR
jgi:hypothetical protein